MRSASNEKIFGVFKISLLLALIPANPDADKTFSSLIYTNVMIPMHIVLSYILEKNGLLRILNWL